MPAARPDDERRDLLVQPVALLAGVQRDLAAKGIRANVVSPGNVYFKGGVWNIVEQRNPEMFASMLARNPTGRMGTPEEVAQVAESFTGQFLQAVLPAAAVAA